MEEYLRCWTVSRRPVGIQQPCQAMDPAQDEPRRLEGVPRIAATPLVARFPQAKRVTLAVGSVPDLVWAWACHAEGSIRLPACRTPSVAARRRAARPVSYPPLSF